ATSYLFVTDRRRRLGEVGLHALIETAKSLADLREHRNIKPHSIRHAAATRLLRNGADLRSIQQFLGHSQLQTTAMYLHTDEQQLQRIAGLSELPSSQASPIERTSGHAHHQRYQRSLGRRYRNTEISSNIGPTEMPNH